MAIDLVTVVFSAETPLLRMQARSLALHLDPTAVAEIFVLVNDRREAACVQAAEALRPAYGPLAGKVRIVPATALFRGPGASRPRGAAQWRRRAHLLRRVWPFGRREGWRGTPGWRSQQALKLAAARIGSAEHVLILDAKNHLLRPTASPISSRPAAGRARRRSFRTPSSRAGSRRPSAFSTSRPRRGRAARWRR